MKKMIEKLSDQISDKIAQKFLKITEDVLERIFLVKAIDVAKINLQPGDVVILKYGRVLSREAYERLRSSIEPHFPDNKVLIFEDGLNLSVIVNSSNK